VVRQFQFIGRRGVESSIPFLPALSVSGGWLFLGLGFGLELDFGVCASGAVGSI
jgi:hypothetical protein